MIDRAAGWEILCEFTKSESLRKHALAVEAAMRAYARKYGEDEESWGIVGMLHDFDYEIHPTAHEHPMKGAEILRQRGVPEDVVYSVCSHADYSGCPRVSLRDKAVFATDELVGFLTACALVRPGKAIYGMEASSVRKKMKDKSFAKTIHREDLVSGAAELGVDLDEHIAFVIQALEGIAPQLGLDGQPQLPKTSTPT